MDYSLLIREALRARERSYSPYSHLRVGAALLCRGEKIISGCNVENVSFGATCCAERTAIFTAVAQGETDYKALAVASDLKSPILPCGICLQVMVEFKIPEVIAVDNNGGHKVYKLKELLPHAFTDF